MNQVDAWKITAEDVLPDLVPIDEQRFSENQSLSEDVTIPNEVPSSSHRVSNDETSDDEIEASVANRRKVSFADFSSSIEDVLPSRFESIATECSSEMAESSDPDETISISITNKTEFSISSTDELKHIPIHNIKTSNDQDVRRINNEDNRTLIIDIEPFNILRFKNDTVPSNESKNILDREYSLEEDTLIVPLQPTQYYGSNSLPQSDDTVNNENNKTVHFGSILRRVSCYDADTDSPSTTIKHCSSSDSDISILSANLRRVSFPSDYTILTTYKEPDANQPWQIEITRLGKELVNEYERSCRRHGATELDIIKQQLQLVKCNKDRSAELNLGETIVTAKVCETLEDLFKIINFKSIIIDKCKFDSDTMRELMNMIEYYESTTKLVLSQNASDTDIWKSLCNLVNKSVILNSIVITHSNITETFSRFLVGSLNENITSVKFDNCVLPLQPTFQLVENLASNKTVKELYLTQTKLSSKEAESLSKFLIRNTYLQVLDISNNNLGDEGFQILANGLSSQIGSGLSALFICNNQLTDKSGNTVAKILEEAQNLHTLNISINNLTDVAIQTFQRSLQNTICLEGLGLQSTSITCRGAELLADAIKENKTLEKFNLRGNSKIQTKGLKLLLKAIKNSNVIRLEVNPSSKENTEEYEDLVMQIKQVLKENKSKTSTKRLSRKVSLACEEYFVQAAPPQPVIDTRRTSSGRLRSPAPSPIPSPGSSPATRSRFQVYRVAEKPPSTSRFTVTPIDSPEDLPPRRSGTPMPDIDSEISHFMFDSIDSPRHGGDIESISIVIDDGNWEDSSQSEG